MTRPRSSGVRRQRRTSVTGYLADPGDTEGFARRIVDLVASPDTRARMGYTARAIAEKRGWDTVNAQIAHFMAEALS